MPRKQKPPELDATDQQGDYTLWCILGIIMTGGIMRSPLHLPTWLYASVAELGFLLLCSTFFRKWPASSVGFLVGWNFGWLLDAAYQGHEVTISWLLAGGLIATAPVCLAVALLTKKSHGVFIGLVAALLAAGLLAISHNYSPLEPWVAYILHAFMLLAFIGCAGMTKALVD